MEILKTNQLRIEEALHQLPLPATPEELYDPIRYILTLGGKRIRPALVCMGAELFGTPGDQVLPQALAVEIFHNFTLIHDDIMDEAPLRRGKATVHERWNANVGILSGDATLIIAYQQLAKCAADQLPVILDIFNRTALEICEGQQFDMNFEQMEIVPLEEYLHMIKLKTAVLLGAALQIGATLGKASPQDAQALYDFGVNLGLAFQIKDDLLDTYGDEQFGKQTGGDILAKKKTFLYLKALELASPEQQAELKRIYNGNEAGKVDSVIAMFDALGVSNSAEEVMEQYFEHAQQALNGIQVPEEQKKGLHELMDFLFHRTV